MVWLDGVEGRRNFELGEMPLLDPVQPGVVNAREAREDRQARVRFTTEAAAEAYMAELHCGYPEQVEAKRRLYEQWAAREEGAVVIVLSSNDEDNRGNGSVGGEGSNDAGFQNV